MINEKVSIAKAEELYGVVIDPESLSASLHKYDEVC